MEDLNKLNESILEKKQAMIKKTKFYEESYKQRFLELYKEENEIRIANGIELLETEKERHEWADYPLIPLKEEIMELNTDINYYSYKLEILLKEKENKE